MGRTHDSEEDESEESVSGKRSCCSCLPCVGDDDENQPLHVAAGVSAAEAGALYDADDRVYTVLTWITRAMVARHQAGGLAVPAPILSRTFQVLSEGMLAFMQARKIVDTPFPFPYAQLVQVLLLVMMSTAPTVICTYVTSMLLAVLLSFFSMLGFFALNEVAQELEDPFGFDPNDLNTTQLHDEYNSRVLSLLPGADPFTRTAVALTGQNPLDPASWAEITEEEVLKPADANEMKHRSAAMSEPLLEPAADGKGSPITFIEQQDSHMDEHENEKPQLPGTTN